MTFLAALPALANAALSAYGAYQSSRSGKDKIKQFDVYTPDQKRLLGMLSQQALQPNMNAFGYLNDLFSNDPQAFEDYEAPYLRQFEEDIIPSIMERFGSQGALSSSGLNQTLARAGMGLSENLAAQRANLRQNALSSLGNLTNTALTHNQGQYLQRGRSANPEMAYMGAQNAVKFGGQGLEELLRSPTAQQASGPGGLLNGVQGQVLGVRGY